MRAEPYPWPCPVCDGNPVWREIDRLDYGGPVMEEYCWCDCGAWRTSYSYGASDETVGPHEWYGADETVGDWTAIMDEARSIDRPLAAACRLAPDDAAPRLVLADWCAENGMPEWERFWRAEAARRLETVASASA